MKFHFITFIICCISINVNCQTQDNIFYCGYSGNSTESHLCKHFDKTKSNLIAKEAVDKILGPLGLPSNFILVPCDEIQNAIAVTPKSDGLRYIVYDPKFMESINSATKTDWASISILAHEIGHHLSGHTTSGAENLVDQRMLELEADEFSGHILKQLGATLEEAQSAINLLAKKGDDRWSTHPSKEKRLNAINKGYSNLNSEVFAKHKIDAKTAFIIDCDKRVLENDTSLISNQYLFIDEDIYWARDQNNFITNALYSDKEVFKLNIISQKDNFVIAKSNGQFYYIYLLDKYLVVNYSYGRKSIIQFLVFDVNLGEGDFEFENAFEFLNDYIFSDTPCILTQLEPR